MYALRYQQTFVPTGLWGLLLLAGLFTVLASGLVGLLAALARGMSACRTGEASPTEEQPDGDADRPLQVLWAVPGKVRIGTVTIHVGWIALSLGISVLMVLFH